MDLVISRKKIASLMRCIIFLLSVMHIGQLIIYFQVGDPDKFDFIELLDFDYEGNLPSWYSSFALLAASILLFVITKFSYSENRRYKGHWFVLAMIFLFLAIDEGAEIHEQIGSFSENFFVAEGYLFFAWVVPYGIALFILFWFYLKFLLSLERSTQVKFVLSAFIFLSGAIGVELISANEAELNGTLTIRYSILYTIEEILEMLGVVLFVYALLEYIENNIGQVKVSIKK